MSGNATLRKKLDAMIATRPETYGAPWTALCEEEAHNVLPILGTDPTYNCHSYSLKVNTLPEFKKMGREWDEYETMVSPAFMGKLFDNGVLKPTLTSSYELMPFLGGETEENHQTINYHLKMLVEDAGFLEGNVRKSVNAGGYYDYQFLSLTWEGHDFLNAIREKTVWEKTKKIAAETGNLGAKVLYEIAKTVAAEAVKAALKAHGLG
jgi:hypothetical protein